MKKKRTQTTETGVANDDVRLRVKINALALPQVTVYRGDCIVGTASYGGPLGAVNPGPAWVLSDQEWHKVNNLVRSAVLPGDGRDVWVQ